MVDAQKWLDENYPLEERKKIKKLNISIRNLEGSLKIECFPDLEVLDCSRNPIQLIELNNLPNLEVFQGFKCWITNVNIIECPKIRSFSIAQNSLKDLDFTNELNPERLILLSVRDNNLSPQDLSIFSRFTNLRSLYFGNLGKKQNPLEYNKFHGSLEPLKSLTKLQELNVGGTDVDSGLEHLPDELQWIYCNDFKKDVGCMKLREVLKDFLDNDQHGGTYDFQLWKDAKKKLEAKTIKESLQKSKEESSSSISESQEITSKGEEKKSQIHLIETTKK